jgi:hypothetical protein
VTEHWIAVRWGELGFRTAAQDIGLLVDPDGQPVRIEQSEA